MLFLETRKMEATGFSGMKCLAQNLGKLSTAPIQDGSQVPSDSSISLSTSPHPAFRRFWKHVVCTCLGQKASNSGAEAFVTHATFAKGNISTSNRTSCDVVAADSPRFSFRVFWTFLFVTQFWKDTSIVPCLTDRREGKKKQNKTKTQPNPAVQGFSEFGPS